MAVATLDIKRHDMAVKCMCSIGYLPPSKHRRRKQSMDGGGHCALLRCAAPQRL